MSAVEYQWLWVRRRLAEILFYVFVTYGGSIPEGPANYLSLCAAIQRMGQGEFDGLVIYLRKCAQRGGGSFRVASGQEQSPERIEKGLAHLSAVHRGVEALLAV